jgi:hypothetical protein
MTSSLSQEVQFLQTAQVYTACLTRNPFEGRKILQLWSGNPKFAAQTATLTKPAICSTVIPRILKS